MVSVSSIEYKNSGKMCKNDLCLGNILIETIIMNSLIFWVIVQRLMMVRY